MRLAGQLGVTVLGQIPRLLLPSGQAEGETIQRLVMRIHDFLECGVIQDHGIARLEGGASFCLGPATQRVA